ncbi:MAG: cytochrome C oxidase subunit IV family protein [Bacteroidetes bacterium]|nr:cytochrome C oxidase subunit IV family protein [Bacteroidota bacterium]
MAHHSEEPQITVLPPDKEKIKKLWRVALIMAIVTGIEFIFAFTLEAGHLKTSIFVALTIVKAGYIVGEFMHLRHEVKVLYYSILIPMVFVVWFLVAMIYEGLSILGAK